MCPTHQSSAASASEAAHLNLLNSLGIRAEIAIRACGPVCNRRDAMRATNALLRLNLAKQRLNLAKQRLNLAFYVYSPSSSALARLGICRYCSRA
jgi:hypothetical protein